MTSPTLSHSCRLLETHLQRQWQRYRPEPIPLQIRCALQDKRLLVLAEHSAALRVDAQMILGQLNQVIQGLETDLRDGILAETRPSGDRLLVNLYLRFLGEQKPYAGQQCLLQKPVPAPGVSPSLPTMNGATAPQRDAMGDPIAESRGDRGDDTPAGYPRTTVAPAPSRSHWKLPLWVWGVGSVMCVSAFVGGFAVMLQPCLLRPCTPLLEGKQLGGSAIAQLATAEDWADLQAIGDQLRSAQDHLEDVPRWSSDRDEATQLQGEYGQILTDFGPITQAFEVAVQAVTQTNAPPHPVETWEAAQSLWMQAMEHLKTLSPDNPTYDLGQQKLAQYERYLKDVSNELRREQEAQQILKDAEQAAALAQLHQDKDESLESWQSAQENWDLALQTLGTIPEGTTAYTVAQERIARYQSQLDTVYAEEHKTQLAQNLYQQALTKADEATAAESESRWKVASDRWQAAITSAQQVPVNSPYYFEAQTLVQQYTASLNQAQQQFRSVEAIDLAQQTLNSLCEGTPSVCYFTVNPTLLAVQLTVDYERTVLTSGVVGDAQSRAAALEQIQTLETKLESLSNTTGIPLELYDPDGSLVGTHRPSAG
ncbi:hypothetical protein [Prochlorothrix hollandica]|uniref:hypothetical protein n=1 Tax=Prochlorothrix hollandica TaxID=1223 RepID=UPI0033417807